MKPIFMALLAAFVATSAGAFAAETVKICGTDVPKLNVQVFEAGPIPVNLSREQAEFENLGYIVQRCRVSLPEYRLRGTALVLFDKDAASHMALIYRD